MQEFIDRKRYTWEELVDKYPEQWVVLDKVTLKGSTIIDGELVCVCSDDEIADYYVKTLKEGKRYLKDRTTEMPGTVMGMIYFDYLLQHDYEQTANQQS